VLASVSSATLSGAVGRAVTVEVHVSNGLPGFTIVGLPDAALREARDRVRVAVLSSGLPWPLRRVTVNLAPTAVQFGNHGLTGRRLRSRRAAGISRRCGDWEGSRTARVDRARSGSSSRHRRLAGWLAGRTELRAERSPTNAQDHDGAPKRLPCG
jgi:hypothetical protein